MEETPGGWDQLGVYGHEPVRDEPHCGGREAVASAAVGFVDDYYRVLAERC